MVPLRALVRVAGFDESGEQRVRLERLRRELRVELHRHVPRMRRQLDDLDELAVERAADDLESLFGQRLFVEAVAGSADMPAPESYLRSTEATLAVIESIRTGTPVELQGRKLRPWSSERETLKFASERSLKYMRPAPSILSGLRSGRVQGLKIKHSSSSPRWQRNS